MRVLLAFALGCASTTPQVAAVPVQVAAEPNQAPDRIRIVLERPKRVGQRYHVIRTARLQQVRSVYEGDALSQTPVETDREVELQAVATVLALDGQGGVLEVEYVVESFEWLRGGPEESSTVLEPGVRVILRRGDPGDFRIDGETVHGDVYEALRLAVDSTRDEDQDALFGTSEPQSVGGQWSIGSAAVAAAMSSPRAPVAAEEVSGTATLVSADDQQYRVRATWHVETEDEEWQARRVVHGDGEVLYSHDTNVPALDAELDLRQDWEMLRGNERVVSHSVGRYVTRRRPLPDQSRAIASSAAAR